MKGAFFLEIIDLTGEIKTGMWHYEAPFTEFSLQPLPEVPWVKGRVYCEIFQGLNSQTGTYLETPAHYFGNDNCYLLADVPVKKLVNLACRVLMLPENAFAGSQRTPVTLPMLLSAAAGNQPLPGEALLIGTGWGKNWDAADYLSRSPYFTREAMDWLIAQKPFLLGSDIPRWESFEHPQGFFESFYRANILMLAPCVNLEQAGSGFFRLTALPLHIPGTSCAPCRAVLCREN